MNENTKISELPPIQVSLYKKIQQITNPVNCNIYDIYEGIIGGEWRARAEKYQSMDPDSKEAKAFKEASPNFTGSGIFDTERKDGLITQHSGLICIDFDPIKVNKKGKKKGCIEDGKVDEIKSLLCADHYTHCCFKSISGRGVCVVVKIDPGKHRESFRALEMYYLNKYGYEVDPSCINESRTRFISYDPDLFFNPSSIAFTIGRDYVQYVKDVTANMLAAAGKGEVHNTLIRASRLMGGYIAGGLINEDEAFDHLISIMSGKEGVVSIEIEKKKIRDGIANGKLQPIHADQLREAEVIHDKKDEIIKAIYSHVHEMNHAGRKWTDADVVTIAEKHCQDIPLSKDDVRRIFRRVFDENKDEFGIDEKPDIYKVATYLRKRYDFMRNAVTQDTMYKLKGASRWDELNVDTLFCELEYKSFKFSMQKLVSLLNSDFVPVVDPFKEYFESLPEWDYERDYIGELADYIQADDQEFFKTQFRKMLVRCVGCALYGKENRFVMVFVQEQENTGKTSFIRFLSPFGMEYYTEASLHNDKDTAIALSENFIYNLEELDALNKVEINRLKGIISSSIIKERTPYGRKATARPRRCNFFASTNKTEFLNDIGNTRWLCFNVLKIGWGYKQEVDISKVWAQALALWHDSDFDCQLTKEESDIRAALNKNFEVNPLEKELIKRLYIPCDKLEGEFMSNADIFQSISENWTGKSTLNSNFIGKIMVQLGFSKGTKHQNRHVFRGYYVKKVSAFTNDSTFFDQNSTPVGESFITPNKKAPKLF